MTSQIFIWWLAARGFGLAGLPLARFLFRALPDRGYAFAKALGLLLAGYLAWLLAMLGLAPFGVPLIVISALVVGGVGLLLNKEQRTKNREPRTGVQLNAPTNREPEFGFPTTEPQIPNSETRTPGDRQHATRNTQHSR